MLEPLKKAILVAWCTSRSNGSIPPLGSARPNTCGQAAIERLQGRWPNLILVHTPVHASWLNQIEIYFSIVQRKVLTPNDFNSLASVANRLHEFEHIYNEIAEPFGWKYTRDELATLMARLADSEPELRLAA